jgi:putative SOS response-associated peptidase YedK
MWPRYRLSRRKQIIEEHFDCGSDEPDWAPRFNIAPTQPVPVIRQNPKPVRELSLMRWGLIPSWAKDSSAAASMINARAETAATKPCVPRCAEIPQTAFTSGCERERPNGLTVSRSIRANCSGFAGLWDGWKDPSGQWVKSCSILTTTPNAVTSAVHDRMPVILDPDAYDLWLDPGMNDVSAASELLKPCDARLMRCYPVSTRINSVVNDDEGCSAPVELAEIQDRLFS